MLCMIDPLVATLTFTERFPSSEIEKWGFRLSNIFSNLSGIYLKRNPTLVIRLSRYQTASHGIYELACSVVCVSSCPILYPASHVIQIWFDLISYKLVILDIKGTHRSGLDLTRGWLDLTNRRDLAESYPVSSLEYDTILRKSLPNFLEVLQVLQAQVHPFIS